MNIRPAVLGDVNRIFEFIRIIAVKETNNVISLPEEFSTTIADPEKWIKYYSENGNALLLVAEVEGKIVAVLDWEMTTIGEPLMDLGTSLGYWMSKEVGEQMLSMPFNPRVLMGNISRQELVEMYAEKSGRDVSEMLFYYAFGTFKIAVIAQQIYFRFAKGFTNDKRFENFNHFVNTLGKIGNSAIQSGRI